MRTFWAFLVLLLGIGLGLYLGLWVMFIGGIVQIVEAVKIDPVSSWGIAYGLCRVFFAGFVGWVSVAIGMGLAKVIAD